MFSMTNAAQTAGAMPESPQGMPPEGHYPERQLGENEPRAWSLSWCGEGLGDCAPVEEPET